MIRLNCFFQANEGKYAEALEAAKALVAASQGDQGCIAYDVFESATRPGIFLICETWTDAAALAEHSAAPHFAKYLGVMEQCGTLKLEKLNFAD